MKSSDGLYFFFKLHVPCLVYSTILSFQDVKASKTQKDDIMYLKLLVGQVGKDKISILSCIDYLTLALTQGPGDAPLPLHAAKTLLPSGEDTFSSLVWCCKKHMHTQGYTHTHTR